MANWKASKTANRSIVLMRLSGGNWAASDAHLHVGRGGTGYSSRIGRAQIAFPSFAFPAAGRLVRATMSGKVAATGAHSMFRGDNPQIEIRRLTEAPGFTVPDTDDGHYTQQGSGDKYPGSATTSTGAVTISVSNDPGDAWSKDVSAMVEAMLPKTLSRRNGSPGGGAKWHGFQIRSSDEDNANRSAIIGRTIELEIEIDVDVRPEAPGVLSLTGAVEGSSGPVIVGSATGRTLEAVFAFRSPAATDTCAKAELAIHGIGSDDETPGPALYTTGAIAPTAGGAANVHRIALANLPLGLQGRLRIQTTSNKGKVGDWSSLEDDLAHVELATIPGPPLDIVVQPYNVAPHILFSLNSPDPADTLSGAEAIVTRLPQGTIAWQSGPVEIAPGLVRRADLTYSGETLTDGQRVSVVVRTRNAAGVTGSWSASVEQTMRERRGPTVTPDPGRLLTRRPTFTIADASFDGHRERILHETDDTNVLVDSGGQVVSNQTSVAWQVPADRLAFGQRFRLVASTLADGAGEYGPETHPIPYSVGALPIAAISIPDAILGRVLTRDMAILRTITDPDGAATSGVEMEMRVAATPQGSGALIERRWDTGDIPATTRTGRLIDLLTSATGWVGDTNVAPGTDTTSPTDYSAGSLELVFGSSSTDRGARLTLPTPLDLSVFGSGTLFRLWRRCTSVTNLVRIVLRFEFATSSDWAEYELIASGGSVNTWAEVAVAKGSPRATSGTVDWANVEAIRLYADVSGSYAADLQVRDLRIGTVQTAKTTPDGHIAWEGSVDIRARASNDLSNLASTTLSSQANAGATTLSLADATGISVGDMLVVGGAIPEVRRVTALGPVTLDEALAFVHASGSAVVARPMGAPSAWRTVTAMRPPDVSLSSPADEATITRPWQTLSWSFTGYAGRTLAGSAVRILDEAGELVRTLTVEGTGTSVAIQPFLLDHDRSYTWGVTVTDSAGLSTTSAQREFTTDFAEPAAPTGLVATADPATSTVALSWDASEDADHLFWVLERQADDGSWTRIDGGPAVLDDGRVGWTFEEASDFGARLGASTWQLRDHNGWRASEAASVTATLDWPQDRAGAWQLVWADGIVSLDPTAAPLVTAGTIERHQPPGGEAQEVAFGVEARTVTMRAWSIPSEDGSLASRLRLLMADPIAARAATPTWLKAPPGWEQDPIWSTVQRFTGTPEPGGIMDTAIDLAELGSAVHLAPIEAVELTGPVLSLDVTSHDFGVRSVAGGAVSVTVTVTNIGDEDLEVGTITVDGPAVFTLADDDASGATIAPAASETFRIVFTPSGDADHQAAILVPSDDPDAPAEIDVTGTSATP